MMRNPSVMKHSFAQAPTVELPRSTFNRSFGHKTTIDCDYIYPLFLDEILPGDTVNIKPYIVGRLNTPIYPIMDNLFLDWHWFFVPVRQVWDNFRKFMGEQVDPGDSIDYTIPYHQNVAAITPGTLKDYLGIPTGITNTIYSVLPIRSYQHIYNEWYRDQNLIDSVSISTADGAPDTTTSHSLQKRGKRHDYFTSCLPWLQKGTAIDLPLGTSAPVLGIGKENQSFALTSQAAYETGGSGTTTFAKASAIDASVANTNTFIEEDPNNAGYPGIYADLTNATAATINELRQAFQIQKLLERDARSGTRYPELLKAHFGTTFLDITYRPEFLGGTSVPINISQVAQTSQDGTPANGSVGKLGAYGTVQITGDGSITKSFTEHGYLFGMASVRADITYQQGMHKMWSRETRYDFYWPALAHVGEQAVLTQELYYSDPSTDTGGTGTPDNERVFGYQERWAEYRYKPSMITGKMRSTASGTLDAWHLSEEFSGGVSLPQLNQTFIEQNTPIDRVVAVTTEPDFTLDMYFNYQHARVMPVYSVPGLIDHF